MPEGNPLGRGQLRLDLMLVLAALALVAGSDQVVEVAEVGALRPSLVLEGLDGRGIGLRETLIDALVGRVEEGVPFGFGSGRLLGVDIDDRATAQLGSDGPRRRRWGGAVTSSSCICDIVRWASGSTEI